MTEPISREIALRTLEIMHLTGRVMSAELRQRFPGMHPGHMWLLRHLNQQPCKLSDLAKMMSVSPPTMSNTINALEERGWVLRRRAKDDRRVVWIEITLEGKLILKRVIEGVEARMTALMSAIPDEDAVRIAAALNTLRGHVETALERDGEHCPE